MQEGEYGLPKISNEMFDGLLKDVLKHLVDRIEDIGVDYVPSSIGVALMNMENRERSWGSADIVEYPENSDGVRAVFYTVGVNIGSTGYMPIAAFWTKAARMETERNGEKTENLGFLVVGMTYDSAVNGAFLKMDGNKHPIGSQMFFASDMDDDNTMDTEMLYHLFRGANTSYRKRTGNPVDEVDSDTLANDLFANVRKNENKGDETDER